jgi:glycosyltransferase involved in cell wall biosynthesis
MEGKSDILKTLQVFNDIECYAVKYPTSTLQWLNRMWTIKPFIKIMNIYGINNINSIIAMDYEVIALYRLKKYCEKNGIHLIADSVEWYEKSRLRFPMNIAKNVDTKLRMEYLYPKIKNMICISKFLFNTYKDKIVNIAEIPVTIDKNDEKWSKLQEYIPNKVLTIGYAGNPGNEMEKERIDWLIRAVCELNQQGKECIVIVAGFNKEIIENFAPDLMEYPSYKTNVLYEGVISHIECLDMIAACDFSAIVREDKRVTKAGFPTKLSESLGCGTPVIVTPSGNITDYIKDGINGFVTDSFGIEPLKAAIEKAMLLSHDKLSEMHYITKKNNPLAYDKFNEVLKSLMKFK